MKRFVVLQVSFSAMAASAMAQGIPYVSPGIAYAGHYFDGNWDSGFGTEITGGYADFDSPGIGIFFQYEWYGDGRRRLGVGLQNNWLVGAEVGLSMRYEGDDDPILGLQIGPYASIVGAHLAIRLLVEEVHGFSAGGSAYLKPLGVLGVLGAAAAGGSGRPLRDADGALITSRYVVLAEVGPPIHAEAGQWWLANALAEHGAIGAFLRLASWLRQHNAPAELVQRSIAAAEEEARHADACFAIAGRLLGLRLAPVAEAVFVGKAPDLPALAVMNLLDGRHAEGVAAQEAAGALPHAVDAQVRETLTAIATEEASHARLADDIEVWLRATGGADVVAALDVALVQLDAEDGVLPALPDAGAWGVPTRQIQIDARTAARAALAPVSAELVAATTITAPGRIGPHRVLA